MFFPKLHTLLTALILTFLVACASNDRKTDGVSEQEVYELAQRDLNARNWLAAIETLQLLEENFPFGVYAEQSQLELIYAHYQAQNFADVIANAERFIRLHPQHRQVDYAYYMRGLASFYEEWNGFFLFMDSDGSDRDRGAIRESFDYLSQFVRKFPASPYAKDAQQRLMYLRNLLARSEIHIANYYFKRGAYLAAAKRGSYVVENFQETPAVPDGLAVMAQAYYLLELEDLADNAVELLVHNFPNYPALKDDGSFDQTYYAKRRSKTWFSYVTFGMFDRAEISGFDSRRYYNQIYKEDAPKP